MSARAGDTIAASLQVRRAWAVLLGATLVFGLLAAAFVAGVRFYWGHATARETAALQVISGSGALVRAAPDAEWRLITDTTTIREGDDISTGLGSIVSLTMFDGSTVEVSEDTVVHVVRMRSSRFLNRTKHFILEPERGAVYVGMASRGKYTYVEFTVRTRLATLTMADGDGRSAAGSFLYEALPNGADGATVRVGVLRGAVALITAQGEQRLTSTQQAVVQPDGSVGPLTAATRELVSNGSFDNGLTGWERFQPPNRTGEASVAVVSDVSGTRTLSAVEFLLRGRSARPAQLGIRQRIGKTLRVYSSLVLQFDVKITDQRPLGGGAQLDQFPLTITIEYVDVGGQQREWTYGYYILPDPDRPTPIDRGTKIDIDRWQRIVFDLRRLSPLPRQISALVVYASGSTYQTRVTNLSLTSSELQGDR